MLFTSGCKGGQAVVPIKTSFGTIYINHSKFNNIDQTCVINEVSQLLSEIEKGNIDPYKNKVFKEHPLVEEITQNTHIDLKRDTTHQNVLIPIDKNNQKIVIYKNSNYALYGLYNKNFQQKLQKCFQ